MEERKRRELAAFRDWMYENEKAEATVKKYLRAAGNFMDALGPGGPTRGKLLAYREQLSTGRSPQTVNGALSAINAWLLWKGLAEIRVKYLKVQRTPFTEASRKMDRRDYEALLSGAKKAGKDRLYMVMLTLGGTGIRISELRFITVEAARAGKARIRMKGKSRQIILGEDLRQKLLEYARRERIASGMIFRTRRGNPPDRSNLCHEMKRLCRETGVSESKVFPHSFRHLFARTFYAVERNLANLADVLGHSSIETTRIYVADSAESYEGILKRMGLVPCSEGRKDKKIPQNRSSVVNRRT